MTRDPIYDALKEHSKAKFDADRARFASQAEAADDGGWHKHSLSRVMVHCCAHEVAIIDSVADSGAQAKAHRRNPLLVFVYAVAAVA